MTDDLSKHIWKYQIKPNIIPALILLAIAAALYLFGII